MFGKDVALMCKFFRKQILHKTLRQFSKEHVIPLSSISSFENGRSSNMNYLKYYLVSCETQLQRDIFFRLLRLIFNEVR